MFHLGWFLGEGFKIQDWGSASAGHGYAWNKPDLFVHGVQDLERGGFDLVVIEDSEMVPNAWGGSSEIYLKHALYAPKNDPMCLVPLLTQGTEHIGIVPTACTSFYPPFLLARLMSTLDQMSDGRVGWNIVTSTSHLSAQNYGRDQHFEHDLRYDMADEYVELVRQLWGSWEPDAVVMDEETGVFADHTKVHTIDFDGRFYKSRGPLNTIAMPQGHPVLVQAGGSPRGRAFAAKNAECIVAAVSSVEEMKRYREEVHSIMAERGRKPAECKILFCATPIIADTQEEADARLGRQQQWARDNVAVNLAGLGNITGIDFSTYDLDAPPPQMQTNGSQSTLALFDRHDGRTLRQIAAGEHGDGGVPLVGTADSVASRMGEIMDEVGGDGFLISAPFQPRYLAEIVDGLVPALKRRGLVRDGYPHHQFRSNLLDF